MPVFIYSFLWSCFFANSAIYVVHPLCKHMRACSILSPALACTASYSHCRICLGRLSTIYTSFFHTAVQLVCGHFLPLKFPLFCNFLIFNSIIIFMHLQTVRPSIMTVRDFIFYSWPIIYIATFRRFYKNLLQLKKRPIQQNLCRQGAFQL